MKIIIGDPRRAGWDAIHKEKSNKKVGAGLQSCLTMKNLREILFRGFTPAQYSHIKECFECRASYSNFLKIRRNEARVAEGLDPFEEQVERDLGVRPKDQLG
jgi:hypothetical protein